MEEMKEDLILFSSEMKYLTNPMQRLLRRLT